MVIKYLRRTRTMVFTAISAKWFLSLVTLSTIWLNQFTFRCKKKKKNLFILLMGLKIRNYRESWKEKKNASYYILNFGVLKHAIVFEEIYKDNIVATQNFSLVFVLMDISVTFNVFEIRKWLVKKKRDTCNKRYLGQHKYARIKYAFKFCYASYFP